MSTFDEAQWMADEEALSQAYPTYLIGMSGPPRSGKDSVGIALANLLHQKHAVEVHHRALSLPMRKTIYTLLGWEYTLKHYESTKDVPLPALGGKSIRQAMIALSEEHVKPTYGQGFWGHAMLNTLPIPTNKCPRIIVVTDMGFDAEVEVFVRMFGADNCVWPQIVRPGCTFEGDSRSYVGRMEQRTTIINEGETLDRVETAAYRIYGRLMNNFKWDLPTRA